MNDINQKQLGNTFWKIADGLRGAMNADDFRVYMLSFLKLQKRGLLRQLFPSPTAVDA
jgi:type I restriction enzyme M protein